MLAIDYFRVRAGFFVRADDNISTTW